jgi:hypothetical protein
LDLAEFLGQPLLHSIWSPFISGTIAALAAITGLNAESTDPCGNNQLLTKYIQAGRDYNWPKPGYAKFTYRIR